MRPILYLGDTSLATAASYLAGVMHSAGWSFDYLPSDRAVTAVELADRRKLYVLSDFPASRFPAELQTQLVEQVRQGAGLLMIGGWESFQGSGGGWADAPLAEALPVTMLAGDDRVNCDQPLVIECVEKHPITRQLPWSDRPPLIGGYNQVFPKPGASVVLNARRFSVRVEGGVFTFASHQETAPLLIVGEFGEGRTAALATDAAPHWVGPLVDWGLNRVWAQAPGAEAIEVGDNYARFFRQLLAWTGRLSEAGPQS